MLSLCKVSKSGKKRKTQLRENDIIGFDAKGSSQAIKIFRPTRKKFENIHFGETGSRLQETYRWSSATPREDIEALAELMAASKGFQIVPIDCEDLPVTWAYKVRK